MKLTLTEKIARYLTKNPTAKAADVAEKFNASVATVALARKSLRDAARGAQTLAAITNETKSVSKKTADAVQVGGSHYTDMPVQPWEAMKAVLTHEEFVGFLKGNVIKYSMRAGRKDGSDDAGKARHYMQKLAEVLNGQHA